jgi:hypothetical protein
MSDKPAAVPLMPRADPLNGATTRPPIMPVIKPANNGAPEARAIPNDKGIDTRKTAIPAGKSYLKLALRDRFSCNSGAESAIVLVTLVVP